MDSDSEFTISDGVGKQKKSRLSKKKNKENSKKLYTSTQGEISEPIIGRGGRSIRKTKEEIAFHAHLEAALKLSSEEASSSSGEVLPPPVSQIVVSSDDILKVETDSQETLDNDEFRGASSAETVVLCGSNDQDIGVDTMKVIEGHSYIDNKDSDDEFETEVVKKETEKLVLKRKVGESWVVNDKKKKNNDIVSSRVAKRAKAKYNVGSSDSENESSDENEFDRGTNEDESDEEFVLKKQKNPVNKKTSPQKTITNQMISVPASKSSPLKQPVRPLGPHNLNSPTLSDISSPLQTRQTLAYSAPRSLRVDGTLAPAPKMMSTSGSTFHSPGPSRLVKPVAPSPAASRVPSSVTPGSSFQSPVPSRVSRLIKPVASSTKSLTPGPSSSISSLLSSLPSCLTKSTPTTGLKSVIMASPGVARSNTPKMPAWTPPSRMGKVGSISSPTPSSVIGMRVGLSRNWKSPKPLHTIVKNQ